MPSATLQTDRRKEREFIIESPGRGLQAHLDSGGQTSGVLSHPFGSAFAPPARLQLAPPFVATPSHLHFQQERVSLPRAQLKTRSWAHPGASHGGQGNSVC